jgi:hypothetical protein|tara:strand:- start:10148 stop:10450 length:303 start_codon:yes stop_codon:yes gene_type:complete
MSFENKYLFEVAECIDNQLMLHKSSTGSARPGPEIVSACLRTVAKKNGQEDSLRAESLEKAFVEAISHVRRQVHGKHEQDRLDAHEWLEKWGSLIQELRK